MAKELGPGPHQEPEPGHTEAAHTKSRPRDTGESQMGPYSTLEQAGAGKGRCSAPYISGFSWLWFTVAKWRFKQAQEPDEETGPAAMSENQEPSHTRMPACLLHDRSLDLIKSESDQPMKFLSRQKFENVCIMIIFEVSYFI